MAHLTVWKFDTATGANDALARFRDLETDHLAELQDAALVSWPLDRKRPRTSQARNIKVSGALDGTFWGLLFGLIFFMPLVGAAMGAAIGALTGGFNEYGIDGELISKVRREVTKGTSALFLLTDHETPDRIAEAFSGTSMKLIQSNLSRDQEARLRESFHSS